MTWGVWLLDCRRPQKELGAIEMQKWERDQRSAAKEQLARTEAEAQARKEQLLWEQVRVA